MAEKLATLSFTDGTPSADFPINPGTVGPDVIDIRPLYAKTGKFTFQDVAARKDVAEEYEYQGSGYVDAEKAKGPGQQAAADYVLTGEVSSIIQEVGDDKLVYYKMTSKLTNLRTGVIEWTDEKELRKKFEKQGVSW